MKWDRREWFANPWDGTGMVYVFTGSCGNGMGMEPVEWNGTGLVFISIPVSLSTNHIKQNNTNHATVFCSML